VGERILLLISRTHDPYEPKIPRGNPHFPRKRPPTDGKKKKNRQMRHPLGSLPSDLSSTLQVKRRRCLKGRGVSVVERNKELPFSSGEEKPTDGDQK